MPTQHHLSPVYGLSPIRLAAGDEINAWAGLLLHSRSLTWAFDPESRPLEDLASIKALAHRVGLHPVTDPFGPELAPAEDGWTFTLPNMVRKASLATMAMTIEIDRPPRITEDWWSMSVIHGGTCRLLVAACVAFPPDPAGAASVLNEAARDGRMFGATIGVQY